jgi:hypothetical protein
VVGDAWEREDINALLLGVLDIKAALLRLLQLLEDDDEEADE